jgi:hypothetical protein
MVGKFKAKRVKRIPIIVTFIKTGTGFNRPKGK